MIYDRDQLKENYVGAWDGDDFSLFKYVPQNRGLGPNEARRLILEFKDNKPEAVDLVIKITTRILAQLETRFRDQQRCQYVVASPRSSQGGPGPAAVKVCEALGASFDWLTHLPGALERTHAVAKSARSHGAERPDYSTHIESICYAGQELLPVPTGILLFDDVITRGSTSAACRDVLTMATGVRRVTGLYLGRTV